MIDRQAMLSKALLSALLLVMGGVGLSELEKFDFQKAIQSLQKNLGQTLNLNSSFKENNAQVFQDILEKREPHAVIMKASYESWVLTPITKGDICQHYPDYCKKEGKE